MLAFTASRDFHSRFYSAPFSVSVCTLILPSYEKDVRFLYERSLQSQNFNQVEFLISAIFYHYSSSLLKQGFSLGPSGKKIYFILFHFSTFSISRNIFIILSTHLSTFCGVFCAYIAHWSHFLVLFQLS